MEEMLWRIRVLVRGGRIGLMRKGRMKTKGKSNRGSRIQREIWSIANNDNNNLDSIFINNDS